MSAVTPPIVGWWPELHIATAVPQTGLVLIAPTVVIMTLPTVTIG